MSEKKTNFTVTDIKIFPSSNGTGNIKAYGNAIISGIVKVQFSVVSGTNGLFVQLPTNRKEVVSKDDSSVKEVKFYPQVIITDKDNYKQFTSEVVKKFEEGIPGQPQKVEENKPEETDGLPF